MIQSLLFVFTECDVTPFPSLNNASLTTTKKLWKVQASLIFVSLYTINIVIPEGLFVFTYRNKKWHDAFISGFHHSLEKDPRGFRNAKTVYTICQLFAFFSRSNNAGIIGR